MYQNNSKVKTVVHQDQAEFIYLTFKYYPPAYFHYVNCVTTISHLTCFSNFAKA